MKHQLNDTQWERIKDILPGKKQDMIARCSSKR